MTLSLAIIEAMADSGCTAAQILAAARAEAADRERRRRERAWRREAARSTTAGSNLVAPVSSDVAPVSAPPLASVEAPSQQRFIGSGGLTRARGRKGLGLASGLSGTARQVGVALLEYCNAGSGIAWPSVKRLSDMLKISMRSVKRATAALDAAGLIRRQARRGQRTIYIPVWSALAEVAGDWDLARMMPVVPPETGATSCADRGQKRPQSGDKSGPRYQDRIPVSSAEHVEPPARAPQRSRSPDPRQASMLLPIPGGRAKADPAYGQAGDRLWRSLKAHGDAAERDRLFSLALGDGQLLERATLAEMDRPGAGVAALQAWLKTG